ncbi:DUF2059 domain-containing protein [Burkholderia ubonensis]|uniref:DUF2059 domain-containing protein n=1 Tax=Burkholderia ubonensis TaxID=101571 RepID=UPI00075B3E1A|nr:DUF2059 domain-containing protein [Burkholderia ubonensis]KVW81358.1 hypothetical protein WK99_22210 [Burkholderia ubonensis]
MQKPFKQWALLAATVPVFAVAQSNPTSAPATAPIDAAQTAAIKDLLDAIDAPKLVSAIANSAEMQSKQLVPAILSDALSANKTLNDQQKQAAVPGLEKDVVPKLQERAGQVFATPQFRTDAIQAQYDAYAKHYSPSELKSLTTFYRSPTGRKFLQVQDQVGREVMNGLMQKYMPQAIQATRAQADQAIETIQR